MSKILSSAGFVFGELSKKSDKDIGVLLLKEVWAELESFSRKSDIVDEACTRLMRSKY